MAGKTDRHPTRRMPRTGAATSGHPRSARPPERLPPTPTARFHRTRLTQCPSIDPDSGSPRRRTHLRIHLRRTPPSDHIPSSTTDLQLVRRSLRRSPPWAPETTAARRSTREAKVRRDPMAMLPFCGYNMGDYFNVTGSACSSSPPRPASSTSTGSRKDENGKFLWPGLWRKTCASSKVDRKDRVRGRGHRQRNAHRLDPTLRKTS